MSAPAVTWRVLRGQDGIDVPGAVRTSADRLRMTDGATLLELSTPRSRQWGGVRLMRDDALPATQTGAGWAFAGSGELDVLEVRPGVPLDDAEALTVLGAFTELGGPATLGRFLVGGQVLDPTSFGGARCPSEQTALGLYRAARLRGGAFWVGVAELLAEWTAARVQADVLVHDLLGERETHTRFVCDAVLLLAAHGDAPGTARAMEHLEALGMGDGVRRWWRHDSLEDGSDLVLNTHLLALMTRRAVGLVDDCGVGSLHDALRARPPAPRAVAHAMHLLAGDAARAVLPGRAGSGRLAHSAEVRAARERSRHPHLLLPGGRTARDVRPTPAPAYHTVNTADLASYAVVTGDPVARRAAEAAARYARASGHWRALLADGDAVVLLVPALLLRLGQERAARAWAERLRAQGWAPAIGWPDHVDAPWERLPAGAL